MTEGNNIVGRRIRQRLEELDRGPTWLARRLGRHPTTVSAWLNGRSVPGIPQLREIADKLDCSVAWLLGEIDARETNSHLVRA